MEENFRYQNVPKSRIATFDVFYTYRRPDFISVSDLLAKGYPLRPPK
jgi:hypothetical protein